MRISGEGFNLGTGSLMSREPGWQWVDSCSWQDSWSLVSGPTGSEVEYEVECYAKCAFAEFRPKVKYWVGANATLLEVNLTVVSERARHAVTPPFVRGYRASLCFLASSFAR